MNPTVKKNLEMMIGAERGQMQSLMSKESMGGNAGTEDGKPCLGANFFYDTQTGEIKYFENIQNVPWWIANKYTEGTFRIAIDTLNTWKPKIVNTFLKDGTSEEATRNLEQSVELYNKQYGY